MIARAKNYTLINGIVLLEFQTDLNFSHGDHERPLPGARGVAEVSSRCARSRQTWDGAVSEDGRRVRPVTRLARAVFRV